MLDFFFHRRNTKAATGWWCGWPVEEGGGKEKTRTRNEEVEEAGKL